MPSNKLMPKGVREKRFHLSGDKIDQRYGLHKASSSQRARENEALRKADYEISHREVVGYWKEDDRPDIEIEVQYHPEGKRPAVGYNVPRTDLAVWRTDAGLLVSNMQSYHPYERTGVGGSHVPFLNSRIGADIGLDALKSLYPDQTLHVIDPGGIKRVWGRRSEFHLNRTEFVRFLKDRFPEERYDAYVNRESKAGRKPMSYKRFLKSEYPKEYEAIIRRMLFEHPGSLKHSRAFPREEFSRIRQEVEAVRSSPIGRVPGAKLLKKAAASFDSKHRALGNRRAKGYYTTVPKRRGFVRVREKVDFGEKDGKLFVSRYEPKEPEPGIDSVWTPIKD
jgi:hypothetical protein